jgi:hypothetical protein
VAGRVGVDADDLHGVVFPEVPGTEGLGVGTGLLEVVDLEVR